MRRLYSVKALAVFIVFFCMLAITAGKAEAYSPIATNIFPNPAASNYELYMTVGTGDFNGPIAASVIFSDSPGNFSLTIQDAVFCNSNAYYTYQALDLPTSGPGYFNTYFSLKALDQNSLGPTYDLASPITVSYNNDCNNRDRVMNFTLGAANYIPSLNKYAAVFIGATPIFDPSGYNPAYAFPPGAAENSFRIIVNGPGSPKAVFAPSQVMGSSFFNLSNRNRPVGTAITYTVDLALPCSDTRQQVQGILKFYDVDDAVYHFGNPGVLQTYGTYPTIRGSLYEGPFSGEPTNPVPGIQNTIINGGQRENSSDYTATFFKDRVYRLILTGLSRPNAIQYNVGFDFAELFAQANCPPPQPITVQGRLFDAENMGISYAGITIETCTGQYPVTDGNGFYSFNIPSGTAFCISAVSLPQYTATAGTRPWAEGYNGCAGFDGSYRTPNYCTAHSTYECQTAGLNAGSGCGIAGLDRTSDTGYDIAFTIQKVTVQGVFYNAYNMSTIPNVQMAVCGVGTVTANASGNYSFVVKRGANYCIRPSANFPAGYSAYNIRPYTPSNYGTCTPFTNTSSTSRVPNYCPTYSTYECQLAGVNGWPGCDTGTEDRNTDAGQDFVFRFPPMLSCSVGAEPSSEVGTNYVPNITVKNEGTSGRPAVETGIVYLTINGTTFTGDFTPSNLALIQGNSITSPGGFTMAPASVALPNAQNYPITAGFSAVSPGAGDGITATNNGPCVGSTSASRDYRPYLKVYGSDVSAGGGFITGSCNSTTGSILAFSLSAGGYRGSSGQFGVTALMAINEFYSASQRVTAPVAPKGLSFRNNVAGETYGGNFGGGKCIPDYYGATQDPAILNSISGNIQAVFSTPTTSTQKQYIVTSPSMGPPGDITINNGRQKAIYYEGNIYIDRNIIFSSAGRTSREDIPFFALIVKGNIYISPTVSRLDGVYMAQPHTGMESTEGRIYTCAAGAGVLYTPAQLDSACSGNPLAVNGALIAQQVKFLRTLNSLRDSLLGEVPNFADGSRLLPGNTRAAEIINFTPEIYMAPSPLKDPTITSGSTQYRKPDAIFSLPPVF